MSNDYEEDYKVEKDEKGIIKYLTNKQLTFIIVLIIIIQFIWLIIGTYYFFILFSLTDNTLTVLKSLNVVGDSQFSEVFGKSFKTTGSYDTIQSNIVINNVVNRIYNASRDRLVNITVYDYQYTPIWQSETTKTNFTYSGIITEDLGSLYPMSISYINITVNGTTHLIPTGNYDEVIADLIVMIKKLREAINIIINNWSCCGPPDPI